MIREKRPREEADLIELSLSRRPKFKVVKKQDQNASHMRFAFATLDEKKNWRTAARGATDAQD